MLRGQFYLRLTSHGNLIGEYTNELLDGRWLTHTGDRTSVDSRVYEGNYNAVWFNDTGLAVAARLLITSDNGLFTLQWTPINPNDITGEVFEGNGRLTLEGVLEGIYEQIR